MRPVTRDPRSRVAGIQRSRLLAGALGTIDEHGYAGMTVARITTRARVSRRTFYELFENREACLEALIDETVGMVAEELAAANLDGLPWRERVRGGLWTILSFLDREPALARMCVVQALGAGPRVLERREQILERLARVLDEGRLENTKADCPPLTAEGMIGAALAIIHRHLLRGGRRPLLELHGELLGIIVLPYLGPAAARREQARAMPATTRSSRVRRTSRASVAGADPLQGLPMRLTYRTARVLECIAERPGVSNREVAERADISDQGQISKLLARLERLELAVNVGQGHASGMSNAWKLTPLGQQLAGRLRIKARPRERAS